MLKPGTPEWSNAVKQLKESQGKGQDFRVATLKDATALLREAKGTDGFGNAIKAGTKESEYARGFQQHGVEIEGNTPWHTMEHLKFKDALGGLDQTGHIFFGK